MLIKLAFGFALFALARCDYDELYRPQFHFSPPRGWMNDPNGLVYHDGIWEMFYQYYPQKPGGIKYWGHTRSKDLFHWENLHWALGPIVNDEGVWEIWSGSGIMDDRNLLGFQKGDNVTMVAIYTYHGNAPEAPALAYSTDMGMTFTYYTHDNDNYTIIQNPTGGGFRDPKIFQYNDYYVILVATGDRVNFYKSNNLKDWEKLSEFGPGEGFHTTDWECVDLFPLKYNDEEKWVLTVNEGRKTQYFIGNFDGTSFINDNPKETVLYNDYGPESYAGVSWNSAPDNRRVWISWVPGTVFGPPTDPWEGLMSVARELSLIEINGKPGIASQPVREIETLYTGEPKTSEGRIGANSPITIPDIGSNLLDIQLSVNLSGSESNSQIGMEFRAGGDSINSLKVYFDNEFKIDRSLASEDYPGCSPDCYQPITSAPRFTSNNMLNMRIILDTSIIELYGDNGITVLTSTFYSKVNLNGEVKLFYEASNGELDYKLTVNQLQSIWH